MSQITETRALYNALVNSGNIRYVVLPDAAVGAPIVDAVGDAAWAWSATATSQQINANCAGNDPCWLSGFTIVQSTFILATTYADLQLGRGALGAEVWLGAIPLLAGIETPVGLGAKTPVWLRHPIRITGNPRLCGRIRNSVGGVAEGIRIKVILETGLGT